MLEWLVVMLILSLSCGVWVLNGLNQQQNHLRHMKYMDSFTDSVADAWNFIKVSPDKSDME